MLIFQGVDGGNSNIFGIFTLNLGELIQFDEHIFQMGWFNHQLGLVVIPENWFMVVFFHEKWRATFLG